MNKFALLLISLLVLIIGVSCASAADINGTIDDSIQAVDHQCSVDEIDVSSPDISQEGSVVDHIDDVNGIDASSHDDSLADDGVDTSSPVDVHSVDTSKIKPVTDLNSTGDNGGNSTNDTSAKNLDTPIIIDDNPKDTDTSAQKQNSLRPDIAKYSKYFQKNQYKTMPNGKKFCEMGLLLEISKHYSFEDTVIIAMHVLRDNGVRVTFNGVEAMLKQMADGTVYTYGSQNNVSYYKDEMQKIHESHKALNVNAVKYSDIYKNMSAQNHQTESKAMSFMT